MKFNSRHSHTHHKFTNRKKLSNLLYYTALSSQISAKHPCNEWQKKGGANSGKQKLKFTKFKLQTSKFLVKFSLKHSYKL